MSNPTSTPEYGRGFRLAARGLIITATAAAFVTAGSLSASAAPGDTPTGSVDAHVVVGSTFNLSLDQEDFTLTGLPLTTAAGLGAVTGTVTTNNAAGYSVSVRAATDALAGTAANADTIPIADLQVADTTDTYRSLSTATSVVTQVKPTRSDVGGDDFIDDYRVNIPDVNSDTYSVTLNYTASATV